MHYYQKNIGDYRRDTMHLSPLEHGVYNLLMDTYYLTETPLSADHANLMRTHCLRSADEVSALENVLKDFFDLVDIGYIHKRCDVEIEAFHSKSKSASESAKARWERVRCERIANALRTECEGNADAMLTINHKPITNNHKSKSKDLSPQKAPTTKATRLPKDWVLPKSWGEWALSEKPHLTVDGVRIMADTFRDHWIANASRATGKKDDWLATWRNWVRNQKEPRKQPQRVQEARLDFVSQVMGGRNGNDRTLKELNPRPAIEGDAQTVREIDFRVREPDGG